MVEQALQEFFVIFLLAVINIAVPVIVAAIYRWIMVKVEIARTRLTDEQEVILDSLIAIAVKAEEQSGLGAALKKSGEEKLQGAVLRVQDMLNVRGLKYIPVAEIVHRIEAAIKDGVEQGQKPYVFPDSKE